MPTDPELPFLTDVTALRARAREHLGSGAVTRGYAGVPATSIAILQAVLATEIVCVLRYTQHAITGSGIASKAVKAEFAAHAREEEAHAMLVAERIAQLGGTPDFSPEGLATRSVSEFRPGDNLVDMIRENLIAERIAVEHYRELIGYFADKDPTTRAMLERILADEEEHADEMHDLLQAHQGRPMLTD